MEKTIYTKAADEAAAAALEVLTKSGIPFDEAAAADFIEDVAKFIHDIMVEPE